MESADSPCREGVGFVFNGAMKAVLSFIFLFFILGFKGAAGQTFEEYDGKVFPQMGPNCFSSTLKLAGFRATFRTVDVNEFRLFLELSCEEAESAQEKDVGIYFDSNFNPIHTFVYMDEEFGIDRPCAEELDSSPVSIRPLTAIAEAYPTSPKIFRCENLKWNEALFAYRNVLNALEKRLELALEMSHVTPRQKQLLGNYVKRLHAQLEHEAQKLTPLELLFHRAQVVNLERQIEFLK